MQLYVVIKFETRLRKHLLLLLAGTESAVLFCEDVERLQTVFQVYEKSVLLYSGVVYGALLNLEQF